MKNIIHDLQKKSIIITASYIASVLFEMLKDQLHNQDMYVKYHEQKYHSLDRISSCTLDIHKPETADLKITVLMDNVL